MIILESKIVSQIEHWGAMATMIEIDGSEKRYPEQPRCIAAYMSQISQPVPHRYPQHYAVADPLIHSVHRTESLASDYELISGIAARCFRMDTGIGYAR